MHDQAGMVKETIAKTEYSAVSERCSVLNFLRQPRINTSIKTLCCKRLDECIKKKML